MKLIKSIATVGGFTALSRITGFVRDVLIASYMGAGPVADAFFVSFKFPNLFRRLFAEGAFNAAFVPTFASIYASKGLSEATKVAEQVFAVMLMGLLILVVLVEAFMPTVMRVIVPGFVDTPERLRLAIEFTQVTFPYLLFISLAALLSGVLNSLNRFAAAAAAPILLNVCMIAALVFLTSLLPSAGHALTWGVLVAGLSQFIWLYVTCSQSGAPIRFLRPQLTPNVVKILKLMLPGVVGAGVMQVNIFIDMIIASLLPPGAVSYLFYADRLNQLPLSLTGIAISTVLLPVLAKHLKTHQQNKAMETQNRSLEFGLFLVLPATVALILLSDTLIHVLFERGKFGALEVRETSMTLVAFVCGLPAYVLVKVFSTSLFARQDTKTPVMTALVSMVLNLVLNIILMKPFQHVGIAAATAIAAWANAMILGIYLHKHRFIELDARIKAYFPRILGACLIMGLFVFVLDVGLERWLYGRSLVMIGAMAFIVCSGILIFISAAIVLKAIDLEDLKKTLFAKSSPKN